MTMIELLSKALSAVWFERHQPDANIPDATPTRTDTPPQAEADLRAAGKSDDEISKFQVLFNECRNQVDSKQLRPFIRTQYMRTAFQVRALVALRCAALCHGWGRLGV